MSFGNHTVALEKVGAAAFSELIPLLREIANLKRIRAAQTNGQSFAARLFERAWTEISSGGAEIRQVALQTSKNALIAANLGAIDAEVLRAAELDESEIGLILNRAFNSVASPVDADLLAEMNEISAAKSGEKSLAAPHFVELLSRQPRSGATKVGAPKLIFDQPENHAEHSIIVGIYGVLLAPLFGADLETVFLAALTHHFHNAYLPDSGFAGEESLGEFLPRIFDVFRRLCLAEVPENIHEKIRNALKVIETADAPEAKAFHAADVFDRVLQMRHHAEANEFTLKYALEEAELVHAGAIQEFHYEVLRAARLI
ncbi:MAG: HD domain-containing protein [Acidobacteriota bacterium]|nr:HD domain-containing protein [Acidobacteriota bacterium]